MGKGDTVLLLIAPILGTLLICILWRRRIYADFGWFFVYVSSSIVIPLVRVSVIRDNPVYFKIFWTTEAIYAVLALFVLHEVFRRVFVAFYVDLRYKLLFPIVALLALFIAIWAALHNPPTQASPLIRLILFFGVAVNLMQVCLVSFLVFLADTVRLRWRLAPLGIVLGFAFSAFGSTFAFWLRSEFGTRFGTFGKYAPPIAYLLAVAVWLITFLWPEPEPQWTAQMTLKELTSAIRRETKLLKGFLDRRK
jgi:hypothetical protein